MERRLTRKPDKLQEGKDHRAALTAKLMPIVRLLARQQAAEEFDRPDRAARDPTR